MEMRDSRFLRPPVTSVVAGAGKSLADPAAGDTAATNLSSSSGSSSSICTPDFLSQVNAAIKWQPALGEWNRTRAFTGCCFRPRVLVLFDALTVQIERLGAYF